MRKVTLGKFRLLLNFAVSLFGRRPTRASFEVEWENLPYSFHVEWFKDGDGDVITPTTRRSIKPPTSK